MRHLGAVCRDLVCSAGCSCQVAERDGLVGDLTLRLGAEMLILGGRARDLETGTRQMGAAIASGAGLKRLRHCVALQGGDVRVIDDLTRLPRAPLVAEIRARASGKLARLDAGLVGRCAPVLGAGRQRKEDRVDAGVGIDLDRKVGDDVMRGDRLATIRFSDRKRWAIAKPLLEQAFVVARQAKRPGRLVLEAIA